MCLEIRRYKKEDPIPKYITTNVPILVRKRLRQVVQSNGAIRTRYKYESPFYNMTYRFKRLYKSVLGEIIKRTSRHYSVNEGLHSYDEQKEKRWNHEGTGFYPAVIPAGSKFLRGKDKEIVSDQLIVFMTEKSRDKWLKENK